MNNETNHVETNHVETNHGGTNTNKTTLSTWGRVAEQHMERMSEMVAQNSKLQAAMFDQSKELFSYNMKLAGEFQDWAKQTRSKVAGKIFGAK